MTYLWYIGKPFLVEFSSSANNICNYDSYELQLELECRKKGLGKFMLQILELLAFKASLQKVVLTVFLHNPNAVGFFKSNG